MHFRRFHKVNLLERRDVAVHNRVHFSRFHKVNLRERRDVAVWGSASLSK